MAETPEKNRIEGFPNATPDKNIIAHNGLSALETTTAAALGYQCVDIRFELGRRGAELTLLGVRQRTVDLDTAQLRAALAEVAAYAKTDTGIGSGTNDETVSTGAQIGDFFRGLGSTNATGQWKDGVGGAVQKAPAREAKGNVQTVAPREQKPRRGRPPGAKDSKPRAPRGTVVGEKTALDMDAMMESLINERK